MNKLFSRVLMFVLAIAATFMLAGCDYEENIVIDEKGNLEVSFLEWFSFEEAQEMLLVLDYPEEQVMAMTASELEASLAQEEGFICTVIGDDGRTYFCIDSGDGEKYKSSIENSEEFIYSVAEFIYNPKEAADGETAEDSLDLGLSGEALGLSEDVLAGLDELMGFRIKVTLPDEIVYTNGILSEDKKTASFNILASEDAAGIGSYYAFTAKSDKLITLDGLTDGRYVKGKKVKVVTNSVVKSIKVNGTEQKSKTISLPKNGEYTIEVATDTIESTFTVIRDTAKPKVTGVKNNKTYSKAVTIKFSDEGSGIKSATLNGKKISTKKKVKANGDYTLVVTDNAGNVRTVKFTIKK